MVNDTHRRFVGAALARGLTDTAKQRAIDIQQMARFCIQAWPAQSHLLQDAAVPSASTSLRSRARRCVQRPAFQRRCCCNRGTHGVGHQRFPQRIITMSDSLQTHPPIEARMAEIVFPNHTNHMGTLFGGQALAWMDKAAFLAASRYARRAVVTARSDQVDFKLPIRQGQMVETIARVVSVGRSSIKVEVELIAEDLLSGARELCTRGHFVMIALDADGKPTSVPPLPSAAE